MPTPSMPLPPSVRQSLHLLARRVRLGRLLRGLGVLFAVLTALLAIGFALDLWLGLGTPELRAGLVFCGLALFFNAVRFLLLPLVRPAPPESLAALLEARHPELAERLTSLIHLARTSEEGHGSAPFKQALADQTEQTAPRFDSAAAYPLKSPARAALLGAVALTCLFLIGSSSFVGYFQRLLGSFAAPWHGYTLEVSPGNHAFPAGQAVNVRAALAQLQPSARLPRDCWLVLRFGEGHEKRIPMQPDPAGFLYELPRVETPTAYRVEAGGLSSEEYRLHPVAPLHLIEQDYRAVVSPPSYVPAAPIPFTGAEPARALQYGTLELTLPANRAPHGAKVLWKDQKGAPIDLPQLEPLTWNDRQGRGVWLLPTVGQFQATCVLEAEHCVLFRQPLPLVEVYEDAAPQATLTLSRSSEIEDDALVVPPGDTLLLRIEASDNEGLSETAWELQVNDGDTHVAPLLDLNGKKSWQSDATFAIPSNAKVGDRLNLRLRVRDNRRLKKSALWARNGMEIPESDIEPNTVRQSVQLLIREIDPLRKREVFARRDEIEATLDALIKKVESLRGDVGKLRAATHHQPALRPDQKKRLETLTEKNQDLRLETLFLAEKLLEEDGLDPLSQKLQELTRQELKDSQAALQASSKADAAQRDKELHRSEDLLLQGAKKLRDLFKLNDALAQDRLDRFKLRTLADEEERLARELNKGETPLEKIGDRQEQIRKDLEELMESSPLLGGMPKDREKERTEEAVKRLEELARQAREPAPFDLAKMGKESLDALAQLAKEQAALAARVDTWQANLEKADRIEQARRAAEAMDKSRWSDALTQQKQAEEGLRFKADLFETDGDPDLRDRALRMAKTQESIYRDLFELGEELPRLQKDQQMERLAKIHKAQHALVRDYQSLKVPEKYSVPYAQARAMVEEILALHDRRDFLGAFLKMEEAPPVLLGLAHQLPDGLKSGKEPENLALMRGRAKIARTLASDQTALRVRLEKLLAEAARLGDKDRAGRSKALREKADRLAEELLKLAQKSAPAEGKGKMEAAAKLAQEAAKAMQRVEKSASKTGPETEKEAALKLEMAGKMAREAVAAMKSPAKDKTQAPDPEAAKNVQEGKRDLNQAGMALKKGDARAAAKSMASAAQALKRAAAEPKSGKRSVASGKAMGKTPATKGAGPKVSGKIPDKVLEKFAGKAWGELPGEVKAQLILDLQQRFGPEYQPIIQRYFENLSREERSKR